MSDVSPTRPSLLLAVQDAGNERAWTEFVALYTPLVFGHCVRRGLQEADAADVTQEVMKAVAQAIQRFDYDRTRGSFRAWLLTVTRSKLNNFFSRQARSPQGTGDPDIQRWLSEQPSPGETDEWELEYQRRVFEWAADQVRSGFQEATWQAFWRTAVLHEPVAEVATGLGMSPGAVYIARSRVIARLRDRIRDISEEDGLPAELE